MVSKTLFHLILIVSISIFLSGCSERMHNASSPSDVQNPILSNNDAEKESVDTADPIIKELSLKEAWGEIPIIQMNYGEPLVYYSISENGDLLVGEGKEISQGSDINQDPLFQGSDINEDTILAISNVYTDTKEIIKIVKCPKQICGASINSEWVVWKEAVGTGITADKYEIYYFNRKTKDIKLLYETLVDEDGNSVGGHEPKPSLKGSELLFDVVSGCNKDGQYQIKSRKYDLLTGDYTDIANQFALPSWASNGYFGLGEDKTRKGYSIIYRLSDGNLMPLMKNGAYLYNYVTDGDSVAVVAQRFNTDNPANEPQKGNLWLIENGIEKQIVTITDEDSGGCGWPSMSKRFITWTRNAKAYAFDRKLNIIVNLSSDSKFSVAHFTNSRFLVWSSISEQDYNDNIEMPSLLNIIEIENLPN